MAGSIMHVTKENGEWVTDNREFCDMIENLGDAFEMYEEMRDLIQSLQAENKIMKEELRNERKCIEKCGDFETSYDDLCFMSKDCLIKHCENLRQIARSSQSRKKQDK